MKTTLVLAALGAALLGNGCGGDSHEALAEDEIDVWSEMTEIMTTITDEESAKEAATEIAALAVEFQEIIKKREALGELPDSVKKEFEGRMSEAMQNFFKEMGRVAQIEGAMEQLEKAMEGMNPAR